MTDVVYSSIEPHDLNEVAACWNAAAILDPCDVTVLSEKILDDDGVLPSLRLAARDRQRLDGVCVGALRDTGTDRRGFIKLLAVHPDARRRGIGSELLRRVEYELISAGVSWIRVAESAPNYLTPGIDSQNSLTINFFRQFGYKSMGEAFNMRVDLHQAELKAPMQSARDMSRIDSIILRRATEHDLMAVERFVLKYWAAWLREVQQAFCNTPISVHVAISNEKERSGEVVGFAAYDANNRGTGWFGPMGTDPAFEGKGIGRALLLKCLADFDRQGRSTATIPWVGPQGFYARHVAAEIDRRFTRLEKLPFSETEGQTADRR